MPGSLDLAQERTRDEERRREVLRGASPPSARAGAPRRARPRCGQTPATCDADVHAAERLPRVFEQALDVRLDREVGLRDRGAAELLGECSRALLAAVVVDEHPRALGGERPSAGRADAAGRSGDDAHPCPASPVSMRRRLLACASTSSRTWKASPGSSSGSRRLAASRSTRRGASSTPREINAAVRGAKAAGATEIVVMDCHGAGKGWTFNSLIPEDLDPACEFVVQDEWTEYTEFLEAGCDAALFVGMHARAGTRDGVMNHTISGRDFQNLCFNGTLVGETGINAALCGTWGCPVLLVTGDDASCREGKELLGRRPHDGLCEARASARPARRQPRAGAGTRAHRGGCETGALRPLGGSLRTTPDDRARSRWSTRTRTPPTPFASAPASS